MRYTVLSLVCMAAVVGYIQRTALTVPTRAIQADLGINEEQLGLVMAGWYWAYALLQVPAGWVIDRVGSKRGLLLFVLAWSALTGLAGVAGGYRPLIFLWAVMGLAQTGLVPGAAKAIGGWFPPAGRAFGSGMLGASMALGGAVAPVVAAWLLRWVTWRELLGLYVLPGLVWACVFAVVVPRRVGPLPSAAPLWCTLARMAGSRPMYLLCCQHFFRAAAMALFFTWFPRFLQETRGVTEFESGHLAVWPGIAAMAGAVIGGISSDFILRTTGNRRLSRQGVATVGMIVCTMLAVAACFAGDTPELIALVSAAAFAGTFGGVSGYSVCIDLGGRRIGLVISLMNMCGNIGAGLFPWAVGRMVSRTGRWDLVLPLFAGLFAVDAVCWAFLNPKQPLFEDAHGPT